MSLMTRARVATHPTFRDWLVWVSLGELVGFTIPAVVGAVAAGAGRSWLLALLVAAGICEGLVLGFAQARVLAASIGVRRLAWAAATATGAAVAWTVGMLPSTFSTWTEWSPASAVLVAGLLAVVLLLSIGTAQWVVLRRYVDHAAGWIGQTALAWCAGLAAFLTGTTPLWQPGQPQVLVAVIGLTGAVPMAVTMAGVTGLWLRRRGLL